MINEFYWLLRLLESYWIIDQHNSNIKFSNLQWLGYVFEDDVGIVEECDTDNLILTFQKCS